MSLVLSAPRPAPVRGVVLFALVALGLLASAFGLAPTLAATAGPIGHAAVCHCAHCPGGAACCCAAHPGSSCSTP